MSCYYYHSCTLAVYLERQSTVEPKLYEPHGTIVRCPHVQWNLSYTDHMGPALVHISELSIASLAQQND